MTAEMIISSIFFGVVALVITGMWYYKKRS